MSEHEKETAGAGDGGEPASAEVFACPECGDEFDSKQKLGMHRWNEHKIRGRDSKRAEKRDRSPEREPREETGRQARRRKLIRETILELVETVDGLRGRSSEQLLDLADVIRRDADLMAGALASLAERGPFVVLGRAIDLLLGAGGPLSIFRAFAPAARQLLHRAAGARTERARWQAEVAELVAEGIAEEEAVLIVNDRWAQAA